MTEYDEGTYEMLWDCEYCDTKKLLGLTHRHCPVCGARQDAKKRYFPDEADKVAVTDHVYHGADRTCPACQNPNSAKSAFCANCGAPLEGAAEVEKVEDTDDITLATALKSRPPKKSPKKGSNKWIVWVVLGAIGIAVAVVAVVVLWKKEVVVTVQGHAWTRQIGVEVFSEVRESQWCDRMPAGARSVSRTSEVRSHRKIPDGEDCTTKKEDKGDGTYAQKRVCTTRYREEPVYDDKCHYAINRWVEKRKETATGDTLAEKPAWPKVELVRTGTTLGAERQGGRTETYQVFLEDTEGRQSTCELPMDRWSRMPVGSEWFALSSVVSKNLDCDSIKPLGAN